MKKMIKYVLLLLVIAVVGYNSIYIKKLREVKSQAALTFDPLTFSKKIWDQDLPGKLDSAIQFSEWLGAVRVDTLKEDKRYSNAIAVGNYRYSLLKLKGIATNIREDDFVLKVQSGDSVVNLNVATEFIYGNAIRDASGLVDGKNFSNTKDLNNISEQLNKKVRTEVLPEFRQKLKQGMLLEVVGALEYNKEHIRVNDLEVIPIRVTIFD